MVGGGSEPSFRPESKSTKIANGGCGSGPSFGDESKPAKILNSLYNERGVVWENF